MKKLSSFLFVAIIGSVATGCVVRGGVVAEPVAVVEVEEAPPPPRTVVVETRPGFVWIEGRWIYRGNRYVWSDGRWERERGGHVWVQGRWEQRGRRHVWVEGRWEARGEVRDNRRGPVVRDHRR